jgi:hypothetical protein
VLDLGLARIYGGVHFRTSTEHGALLGKRVGKIVVKEYFQKKNNRP